VGETWLELLKVGSKLSMARAISTLDTDIHAGPVGNSRRRGRQRLVNWLARIACRRHLCECDGEDA
jgi:hypothetical protein